MSVTTLRDPVARVTSWDIEVEQLSEDDPRSPRTSANVLVGETDTTDDVLRRSCSFETVEACAPAGAAIASAISLDIILLLFQNFWLILWLAKSFDLMKHDTGVICIQN